MKIMYKSLYNLVLHLKWTTLTLNPSYASAGLKAQVWFW